MLTPRDTRFFLKALVQRLEAGDATSTSKKDDDVRKRELFAHAKAPLKDFLNKEMRELLYNGATGILVPIIIDKLGRRVLYMKN